MSKNKSSLAAFLAPKFEGLDLNVAAGATQLNKSYLEGLIDGSYATNGVFLRPENAIQLANYLGVSARQILAAQIEDELAFAERVFKVKEDVHATEPKAAETPAAAPAVAVDPIDTVTTAPVQKSERKAGGSKSPMISKRESDTARHTFEL